MSLPEKYFFSLYYAILMIGNNELGPKNTVEMGTAAIILMFSNVLNALIFSEMAVMLYVLTKKSSEYQMRLDLCNHIMATIELPVHYQEDIREFVSLT